MATTLLIFWLGSTVCHALLAYWMDIDGKDVISRSIDMAVTLAIVYFLLLT